MDLMEVFNLMTKKDKEETIKFSYYVINYCNNNNIEINNLKLMKLLYFINIKYMLYSNGKPIFDEEFLAWRHGPVLQSVYNFFSFGMVLPTNERMSNIVNEMSVDKKNIVDMVLEEKSKIDAWILVEKTHVKNGPWQQIYSQFKDEKGICKAKIPYKLIYEFYKENPNEV